MKCARCGRVIKSANYQRIGNYAYGSTCARIMFKQTKRKQVKIKYKETENDYQIGLFE